MSGANGGRKVLFVDLGIEPLRFQNCAWTATEMVGFAEALPFFTKLQKLDLSRNNLSDEGTKILANGLASFVTLPTRSIRRFFF